MALILYLGESSAGSTSSHRAKALERLGHSVTIADPYRVFKSKLQSRLMGPIHYHTGYRLMNSNVLRWLKSYVETEQKPDLVWITSGELFGPESLQLLRSLNRPIVLYNNDDPTGGRDGRRFDSMIKALPYCDLCAVMREQNVKEFYAKNAKEVIRVFMSYDEEAHRPFDNIADIPASFRSEVAFIETGCETKRGMSFL